MGDIMTCKINADTTDGLKLISDTSGEVDIQDNGTTRVTVGDNIDIHGNELILDADGDTSITADTDDRIDFKTAGTDRVHFTSQGNVGVGTNAPTHLADAYKTIEVKGTDTNGSGVVLATSNAGIQTQMISSDASGIGAVGTRTNHPCTFTVNNAEKMRLDSNGNLLCNSTSLGFANQRAVQIQTVSTGLIAIQHLNTEVGGSAYMWFTHNGGAIGSIAQNGTTGVSFNVASDYRLKENVDYTFDATTRLKQLRPCRFNFIADTDRIVDGFLAHEVSSIVPEAITGAKDAVDEDGNPDYQGIDQSKLVPLLVKTIQELEARITALESE
jgi:hypothetical protein